MVTPVIFPRRRRSPPGFWEGKLMQTLEANGHPLVRRSHPLSPRERRVLRLVGQRMNNRKIAVALGIAEGTVKVHMGNIFLKTGLRSRESLIVALMAGFFDNTNT